MSRFADYYRSTWPGPITHALTWLQLNLFPSAFYRRQSDVLAKLGGLTQVADGPFEGMAYGPLAADKGLLPRLLGTYEREIYPAVEEIIEVNPDVIAVAGAGEGYFAVGLARRLPASKVVAFEVSNWGRYLIALHARRNNARVDVRGFCSPFALQEALHGAGAPAVICDIEGGEREVLDLDAVPALKRATVLVELHPMYIEGIDDVIAGRFAASHHIKVMRLGDRALDDLPTNLRGRLAVADALWAANEAQFRGTGLWMLFTPKR